MSLKMVIDYPDNIPDALQETRVEFERNAKLAMFVKLFEMKKISSGMAASILGCPLYTYDAADERSNI